MTKTCPRCQQELPIDSFPWRNKSKRTRNSWCKPCKQAYESEHYRSNGRRKQQIKKQNKKQIDKNKAIVLSAKVNGCVDCGELDPIVLEFDHINDDKEGNVANFAWSGSPVKLKKEIAKCEVVCANCHRRRTHKRRLQSIKSDAGLL